MDFADSYAILNGKKSQLSPSLAELLNNITPTLDQIVPIRNRVAHSRPLQYLDLEIVTDLIEQLEKHSNPVWPNIRHEQKRIKENPSGVLNQIIPSDQLEHINHNLPVPDFDETGFLGRTQQEKQLSDLLKGPYPVISIIGEGGLGKTALALKVAYEFIDKTNGVFEAIVWTSAKSASITAQEIRRLIQQSQHL